GLDAIPCTRQRGVRASVVGAGWRAIDFAGAELEHGEAERRHRGPRHQDGIAGLARVRVILLDGDRRRGTRLRARNHDRKLLLCRVESTADNGIVEIDRPILTTHVAALRARLGAEVDAGAAAARLVVLDVASSFLVVAFAALVTAEHDLPIAFARAR